MSGAVFDPLIKRLEARWEREKKRHHSHSTDLRHMLVALQSIQLCVAMDQQAAALVAWKANADWLSPAAIERIYRNDIPQGLKAIDEMLFIINAMQEWYDSPKNK